MKTTLEISDDLLRRAKEAARRESITLKALTEEGLRLALERRQGCGKPIKFKPVTFGKGRRDVTWNQMSEALYGAEGKLSP